MKIPFLDLKKINAPYESAFKIQFESLLSGGLYILGDSVKEFEEKFATYCGVSYCIGTGNGLDALTLILKGYIKLGQFNEGDEVYVAANTYIATIIAVQNAGLVPILIDADKQTFNLDPNLLPKTPNKNTKAVLVTHLYGQLADMNSLRDYCSIHNLLLLSDSAQAHGASDINNQKAGSLADASGFSFYPTKNLGALGDGGCVTTNNYELAAIIKKLRNYGKSSSYENDYVGINSRLDEIQAAFLNTKLKYLSYDNNKRRKIASRYLNEINNPKIILPFVSQISSHVFHQFVVRVTDRIEFISYLKANDISSAIHYPIPAHKQKAYKNILKGYYVITEELANTVVSIPINPALTLDEVDYIIKKLNTY